MKKVFGILMAMVVVSMMASAAFAADKTLSSDVSATVGNIFSLEFYTDANTLYTTAVPFTTVDPGNEFNYPDNRAANDGKNDVALLVKSNQNVSWTLKMAINAGSSLLGKIGAYFGQPWNRNWNGAADGSIAFGDWFNLPGVATTVYTAGPVGDYTNTPLGTLASISYKINGQGLPPGDHTATVTYTLTTNP